MKHKSKRELVFKSILIELMKNGSVEIPEFGRFDIRSYENPHIRVKGQIKRAKSKPFKRIWFKPSLELAKKIRN